MPINEMWKSFRQTVNDWILTMDADPWEDLHRRMRRLEVAASQMEVRRGAPLIEEDLSL